MVRTILHLLAAHRHKGMHHNRLNFCYQVLLEFQFCDWYHLIHPLWYTQECNCILSRNENYESFCNLSYCLTFCKIYTKCIMCVAIYSLSYVTPRSSQTLVDPRNFHENRCLKLHISRMKRENRKMLKKVLTFMI